jgi:hypothetical protein
MLYISHGKLDVHTRQYQDSWQAWGSRVVSVVGYVASNTPGLGHAGTAVKIVAQLNNFHERYGPMVADLLGPGWSSLQSVSERIFAVRMAQQTRLKVAPDAPALVAAFCLLS